MASAIKETAIFFAETELSSLAAIGGFGKKSPPIAIAASKSKRYLGFIYWMPINVPRTGGKIRQSSLVVKGCFTGVARFRGTLTDSRLS